MLFRENEILKLVCFYAEYKLCGILNFIFTECYRYYSKIDKD